MLSKPNYLCVVRLVAITLFVIAGLFTFGTETAAAQEDPCSHLQTTSLWMVVVGTITVDDEPVSEGAIVEAINPRGDVVGCKAVTNAGYVPSIFVYGETITPTLPGMLPTELIEFRVDGLSAISTEELEWFADNFGPSHWVTLTVESSVAVTMPIPAGNPSAVNFTEANASVDFSSGVGGNVTVTYHYGAHPMAPPGVTLVPGHWNVAGNIPPDFSYDLSLIYDEAKLGDINEQDIIGAAYWDEATASWQFTPATVVTLANLVIVPNVTWFGDWILLASAPPQAPTNISLSKSGADLQISWEPVTQNILGGGTSVIYELYRRANDPYFGPTVDDLVATISTGVSYTDVGVIGNPEMNYYYVLVAVDLEGRKSSISERFGEFDFAITPGDVENNKNNLIAVPLQMASVVDAESLSALVGSGVFMIMKHDAATQVMAWRLPGLIGTNFPVGAGDAVFLNLDSSAPSMLTFTGTVPTIGSIQYSLARAEANGSCKNNFLSTPLHIDSLADADGLSVSVENVFMAMRYDSAGQSITWRLPEFIGTNFDVATGYPYIVCLDQGAKMIWP